MIAVNRSLRAERRPWRLRIPAMVTVVVVGGESLDELDCVLVGARLWLGLGERDSEFGDRAALPADRQRCAAGLASEVDGDVLDQAPDELLAVAVGGGGCGPDAAEVGAEGEQPLPFLVGQRAGLLLLAQSELGFGRGELLQRVLPVALQSARDESVLGLDLAVAALGPLCLVSGAFDLQPPLLQRGVLIGLERLGGLQRRLHAGWGERGEQRLSDRLVDPAAADPQAPAAAVLDQDPAGAVVARAFVAATTVIGQVELAPAAAAHRDPLQQGAALAHGAAGIVRARARVGSDPLAVSLVGGLVDVAGVVIPDQHSPGQQRPARSPTRPPARS